MSATPTHLLHVTPEEFHEIIEARNHRPPIDLHAWMRRFICPELPSEPEEHGLVAIVVERIAPSIPCVSQKLPRLQRFDGLAQLGQLVAWEARLSEELIDKPLVEDVKVLMRPLQRSAVMYWAMREHRRNAVPRMRYLYPLRVREL